MADEASGAEQGAVVRLRYWHDCAAQQLPPPIEGHIEDVATVLGELDAATAKATALAAERDALREALEELHCVLPTVPPVERNGVPACSGCLYELDEAAELVRRTLAESGHGEGK